MIFFKKRTNKVWRFKAQALVLLCNIKTSENLVNHRDVLGAIEGVSSIHHEGAWSFFKIMFNEQKYNCAIYRKRLLVYVDKSSLNNTTLSNAIAHALEISSALKKVADHISKDIYAASFVSLTTYPIVLTGPLIEKNEPSSGDIPDWIDDGLTTFHTRVYDSTVARMGYVRVSRHITFLIGLSDKMNQDIINLLYEEFLYRDTEPDAKAVFQLFDSITDYVLPLEVNLYLQKIFYALAVFAAIATALTPIFNKLWVYCTNFVWNLLFSKYHDYEEVFKSLFSPIFQGVILVFLLINLWILVRKKLKSVKFK